MQQISDDQTLILGIVLATIVMFLWGRWRHDVVAVASLLLCVLAGLVTPDDAFTGFAHPAVITVACVLVLSQGLRNTGFVDVLAQRVLPSASGPTLSIAALIGLGAVLSAFMNNVGAMALLMPVAVKIAGKHELQPGVVLMPLAFATILGGMTTLIGTPPNLIVSGFRADAGMESFDMFDFTPVGATVAVAGVLFIALLGWRIVPRREHRDAASFDTGTYLTEVRVSADSNAAGQSIHEISKTLDDADAQVVGMVRNDFRVSVPVSSRILRPDDVLVIEAEPESLSSALSLLGLDLEESATDKDEKEQDNESNDKNDEDPENDKENDKKSSDAGDMTLAEMVAMPDSMIVGRSAQDIRLAAAHGLNLLAISRQGSRSIRRLRSTPIEAGDVMLLQGAPDALAAFSEKFGAVPLAERAVSVPDTGKATTAIAVMTIAIVAAAFGLLPAAITFMAGVLVFVVRRVIQADRVYEAIDWPVIVLLGALLPVADAMGSTGAADLVARTLLDVIAGNNAIIALAVTLIVTMTLSDFMNNAATAAVMCPVALGIAANLGVSPDAFLMAVAIGASCAMLTPIGHQNNTLILGPGGFRFGDYWRLGLPLEILVAAISIPLLLIVWPL